MSKACLRHPHALVAASLALALTLGVALPAAAAGRNSQLSIQNQTTRNILSGGHLSLMQTRTRGNVVVGGDLNAKDCFVEGSITTGGSAELMGSSIAKSVVAGRQLVLQNSTVNGNVTTPSPLLDQAEIGGTLTTSTPELTLQHTQVGAIRIVPRSGMTTGIGMMSSPRRRVWMGNGVIVGGSANNSIIHNNQVSLWPADSRDLPQVAAVAGVPTPSALHDTGERPVIKLTRHSEVTGAIVFEGGHGRVLVEPGSKVTGPVIGGEVEPLSP